MAARVQCLAKPDGEPCVNRCGTSHPYMPELSCCFSCKETMMVTRESARLTTEGLPIRSADCIKTKFQGVPTDYQHPNGSVGGAERCASRPGRCQSAASAGTGRGSGVTNC